MDSASCASLSRFAYQPTAAEANSLASSLSDSITPSMNGLGRIAPSELIRIFHSGERKGLGAGQGRVCGGERAGGERRVRWGVGARLFDTDGTHRELAAHIERD